MQVKRDKDLILLQFASAERAILCRILESVRINYAISPEQADDALRDSWYSTRGFQRAGLSAAEMHEWQHNLHSIRLQNTQALEQWLDALQSPKPGQAELRLSLDAASTFLTILNDHRLWLAAKFEIGQAEMDMIWPGAAQSLPPRRQVALYEIHLLAIIMEEILRLLTPQT